MGRTAKGAASVGVAEALGPEDALPVATGTVVVGAVDGGVLVGEGVELPPQPTTHALRRPPMSRDRIGLDATRGSAARSLR